jgi:hypothetical protein
MRPLVAPVISFILGMVICERAGPGYGLVSALLILSVIPVLIAIKRALQFRPFLIFPPFFFLGALFILPVASPDIPPEHIVNYVEKQGPLGLRVEGVVSTLPEVRDGHVRLYVDAVRADTDFQKGPESPLSHDTPPDGCSLQSRALSMGSRGETEFYLWPALKSPVTSETPGVSTTSGGSREGKFTLPVT